MMATGEERAVMAVVALKAENKKLKARIEALEQHIAEMQGEGYATASEILEDWWNQSNVQGTAQMTGDDLVSLMGDLAQGGRE